MPSPVSGPAPLPDPAERKALASAARAFEAIMLAKMLASARSGSDEGSGEWRQMADRAVADQLAANGPLGLARLIARSTGGADKP